MSSGTASPVTTGTVPVTPGPGSAVACPFPLTTVLRPPVPTGARRRGLSLSPTGTLSTKRYGRSRGGPGRVRHRTPGRVGTATAAVQSSGPSPVPRAGRRVGRSVSTGRHPFVDRAQPVRRSRPGGLALPSGAAGPRGAHPLPWVHLGRRRAFPDYFLPG